MKKSFKVKKIKNQALLKRGGYSLAITAVVIVGVIIFNILVSTLSTKLGLEFDMSSDKVNSMSQENIDYIKDIDTDVSVIFCADKESYIGGYMTYYAQQYNVVYDAAEYYNQTVSLVEKYADYNSKIDVEFIDTQSAEFTDIAALYANETINYGDIIVSAENNGNKRHKIISFTDIYELYEDESYAAYGYSMSYVSGNNIETALTSAIDYVVSDKVKKIAVIAGHSANDYTASYQAMLKTNNYEIDVISDGIITSISNKYDAVLIAAPTVDFLGSELDAISDFLDNDGMLGKGLLFFADASMPYLSNLYDFLEQWGIAVEEGIVYETDTSNHLPDLPTAIGIYPTSTDDKITAGMTIFITDSNVPMKAAFENEDGIKVTTLASSGKTAIAAPAGVSNGWTGASNYTKDEYSAIIQAEKKKMVDNEYVSSYVMAFSSVQFIQSDYNELSSVSNKDITIAVAERAVGAEDSGILFVSKVITNENYTDKVTESSVVLIRIIFMGLLPVVLIVLGIYVYIKRRNA